MQPHCRGHLRYFATQTNKDELITNPLLETIYGAVATVNRTLYINKIFYI